MTEPVSACCRTTALALSPGQRATCACGEAWEAPAAPAARPKRTAAPRAAPTQERGATAPLRVRERQDYAGDSPARALGLGGMAA